MILTWLIDAVLDVVTALLSAIPTPALPVQDLSDFFARIGSAARLISQYFPVPVLVSCVALVLAARFALLTWNIILWVIHQFWGSR